MNASPSLPFKTLKHDAMVWTAAFSPDGTKIVTGSGSDSIGKVRLWSCHGEALTGRLIHGTHVCYVSFSPDQSCFVSCDKDGTARLWSTADGQPLFEPLQHRNEVWHAAFHPSKPWLATASDDRTVRLWDWTTGQEVGEPLRHPREVIGVRFNADGRRLLAHTAGKRIAVWPLEGDSRSCVWRSCVWRSCVWLEHPARITTSAFSPDGLQVLTGCDDRRLRLWDVRSGRPVDELVRLDQGWFDHADFMSRGASLFGCIGFSSTKETWGDVFRWDCRKGTLRFRHRIHTQPCTAAVCTADSRVLLTASWDKTACVLDGQTGDVMATLAHRGAVFGVTFSPDQAAVLTWSGDDTARIWDVREIVQKA